MFLLLTLLESKALFNSTTDELLEYIILILLCLLFYPAIYSLKHYNNCNGFSWNISLVTYFASLCLWIFILSSYIKSDLGFSVNIKIVTLLSSLHQVVACFIFIKVLISLQNQLDSKNIFSMEVKICILIIILSITLYQIGNTLGLYENVIYGINSVILTGLVGEVIFLIRPIFNLIYSIKLNCYTNTSFAFQFVEFAINLLFVIKCLLSIFIFKSHKQDTITLILFIVGIVKLTFCFISLVFKVIFEIKLSKENINVISCDETSKNKHNENKKEVKTYFASHRKSYKSSISKSSNDSYIGLMHNPRKKSLLSKDNFNKSTQFETFVSSVYVNSISNRESFFSDDEKRKATMYTNKNKISYASILDKD